MELMPPTRLLSVFVLLAVLAAALVFMWRRRDSATPVANVLYIALIGIVGPPLSTLLSRALGSTVLAIVVAMALLFAVSYGRALQKGNHSMRISIAKHFANSMAITGLVLLICITAMGWDFINA